VTVTDAVGPVSERPLWRTVTVPSEHGGWGLTLEPVLLGLIVAPSPAGALLGLAAFLAFLVRTPLKLVVIDARRARWLDRSRLALRVAVVELAVLVGLGVAAGWAGGWSWLVPVALAVPLVGVEFWFDVRSRGRRLIPELCGSVGIASVAAMVVLADDGSARLAAGVWLVLSARAAGSIPFVRTQIARLRRVRADLRSTDVMQAAALVVGVGAVVVDRRMAAGFAGLVVLATLQVVWLRRPPIAAKVLGLRQMVLGVGLVAVTAAGVLAS
jgi:hypothetical protein